MPSNPPAFVCARAACLRGFLAVIYPMPFALPGTSLANVGAQVAELLSKPAVIDISEAGVQQMDVHSLFIWAQVAIIFTSCSLRSDVAQNSRASAHRMQASIQLCHFEF